MLFRIALALLALWILGLVNAPATGGLIHILLVVSVAMFILDAVSGGDARRTTASPPAPTRRGRRAAWRSRTGGARS
jgi:hypothetical protein